MERIYLVHGFRGFKLCHLAPLTCFCMVRQNIMKERCNKGNLPPSQCLGSTEKHRDWPGTRYSFQKLAPSNLLS